MRPSTQAISKTVWPYDVRDAADAPWLPANAADLMAKLLPMSAMWTGRINGEIVAFTGITTIHPHLAEVWSYLHPDALKHRFWLHKQTCTYLRRTVKERNFWRVQVLTYAGHEAAERWVKKLGFTCEAEMPYFGPNGETMTRFVWLPRGING